VTYVSKGNLYIPDFILKKKNVRVVSLIASKMVPNPMQIHIFCIYLNLVNQIKNSQSNKFTIGYMSSETCYFE